MFAHRVGIDENGLGARLGPLLVTGVLARVTPEGAALLARRLPARVRRDLGDSKALVAHGDTGLGEAWARALCPAATTPAGLFGALSLEGEAALRAPCPAAAAPQCWHVAGEAFEAEPAVLARVTRHLAWLAARGVELRAARASLVCVDRLNQERARGRSRFECDLHAMERLALSFRAEAGADLLAVCGKVGGMAAYSRFFGPLAGRLHAVVEEGRRESRYRFPGLGELCFLQDADAQDPLVMVASLVGKYLRELGMGRIARHWRDAGVEGGASGYHDPVTARFVLATAPLRRERGVPDRCFERERAAEPREPAGHPGRRRQPLASTR